MENTETVTITKIANGYQLTVQHDQSGSAYGCDLSEAAHEQLRLHFVSGSGFVTNKLIIKYMKKQIENLGFEKNTKVINGFKPHFKKGNDLLFLIGADYWPGKVYGIDKAFENYNGRVYGVLTDKSPGVSDKDWVTAINLTLLNLNPLSIGQWKTDGTDIEFIAVGSLA